MLRAIAAALAIATAAASEGTVIDREAMVARLEQLRSPSATSAALARLDWQRQWRLPADAVAFGEAALVTGWNLKAADWPLIDDLLWIAIADAATLPDARHAADARLLRLRWLAWTRAPWLDRGHVQAVFEAAVAEAQAMRADDRLSDVLIQHVSFLAQTARPADEAALVALSASALSAIGRLAHPEAACERYERLGSVLQMSAENAKKTYLWSAVDECQQRIIALTPAEDPVGRRMMALGTRGRAHEATGRLEQALGFYEQILASAETCTGCHTDAFNHRARLLTRLKPRPGWQEQAIADHLRVAEAHARDGDSALEARSLQAAALLCQPDMHPPGSWQRAGELWTRAEAAYAKAGDARGRALSLHQLGHSLSPLHRPDGDGTEAADRFAQAAAIRLELGREGEAASSLHMHAFCLTAKGMPPEGWIAARAALEQAIALRRKLGQQEPLALSLTNLAVQLGRRLPKEDHAGFLAAAELAREAATIRAELGNTRDEIASLFELARLLSPRVDPGSTWRETTTVLMLIVRRASTLASPDADLARAYGELGVAWMPDFNPEGDASKAKAWFLLSARHALAVGDRDRAAKALAAAEMLEADGQLDATDH